MARASRTKGIKGEREVAERWQLAGFQVRGLESGGDHLCIRADGLVLASETKYAERWKVAEWWEQAKGDAPQGTVPTLAMRRNHGEWLVLLRLDDLTALLTKAQP